MITDESQYCRVFPLRANLNKLQALARLLIPNIQLRADMGRWSPECKKGLQRFFNSLLLEVVERHGCGSRLTVPSNSTAGT